MSRAITLEQEQAARRFASGIFTGIADGSVLEAMRNVLAAWDAEKEISFALAEALRFTLEHVEDEGIARVGSQCTLCNTYRNKVIRPALAKYVEAHQ